MIVTGGWRLIVYVSTHHEDSLGGSFMQAASRSAAAALAVVIALGSWVIVGAGPAQPGQAQPQSGPLPLEPLGVRGEAVFAAFEGWGPTKDGREVLLFGYYNRNREQIIDIPLGPNNTIEPGGPDLGQPTYFLSGRQYGQFAIEIPKDFGNKRYIWTIVANGQKTQVNGWRNPPYWIDFYRNTANGNETPIVRLTENGPALQGPVVGWSQTLTGTVNQPVTLNAWVSDKPADQSEAPPPSATTTARGGRGGAPDPAAGAGRGGDPAAGGARGAGRGGAGGGRGGRGGEPRGDVTILWQKYRGPADIKFSEERSLLFNKRDAKLVMHATTQATFSQPGEYAVLVTANDQSGPGGGGDQCCWTSARIRITVK
jgi:hypothetical protein